MYCCQVVGLYSLLSNHKDIIISMSPCKDIRSLYSLHFSGSVSPAVTSAAVLPEASDCDKKVSTFKDPELELRRLLEEKYDRGVNIEFKFKESSKGYRVTIIAPVLGYIDGEVCNTKAQARDSAISIALKSLCM